MKDSTKTILLSSGGLAALIFVAWYFSGRKQNARSTQSTPVTASDGSPINISIPPLQVPPITGPTLPLVNQPASSCCKRCADSSQISGGKILQSGNFIASQFAATATHLSTMQEPPPTSTGTGNLGPKLIPQNNGGLPLPSQTWWIADPHYGYIYAQAYNYVISQYNNTVTGVCLGPGPYSCMYHAPAIRTMSVNVDYNTAYTQALDDGTKIIAAVNRISGVKRQNAEQQFINYSIEMTQQVLLRMNQLASQFNDNLFSGLETIGGVQDQSIITIQ